MSVLAVKLNWEGLRRLRIPNEVNGGCYDPEIEMSIDGLNDLPDPLNSASCWIYCRDAWPHVDPNYEGTVFITLAIQADHTYNQILPNNKSYRLGVFNGYLFVVDPLSLHWLAPNNAETNPGFIGLQWEIPYDQFDATFADLTSKLAILGELTPLVGGVSDSLLQPAKYNGVPPKLFG